MPQQQELFYLSFNPNSVHSEMKLQKAENEYQEMKVQRNKGIGIETCAFIQQIFIELAQMQKAHKRCHGA